MKINALILVSILLFGLNVAASDKSGVLSVSRYSEFLSNDFSDSLLRQKSNLVDLGPQISQAAIQSAAFVKDSKGRELVYTVARGVPAHLIGFDLTNNSLILDIPLDSMVGSWALAAASDGILYIGGESGHFYSYTPGDARAFSLSLPLGTETYTWDLKAGSNGEIFGSTYPGCRLFRYHPKDGFSDVGRGALVTNENYARGFALYPENGKIYAGIGSHAHLIELDIASGEKKDILPEKYKDQEFVYDVEIIRDLEGGDRLFATVTTSNKTLIYNLKTQIWEKEIDKISIRTAIKSPKENKVYYGDDRDFFLTDLTKSTEIPQKLGPSSNILASGWASSGELYLFNRYGQLIKIDALSGQSNRTTLNIPPQPISINAVHIGADGKVWTGGYLSGNNAAFDPSTGKTKEFRGLSQTEGITLQGTKMYFGIYPAGRLFVYETLNPWDPGKGNPRMISKIAGQSRFYAGVDMGDNNTMFFGSVPEYGHLGGALVEYKSQTGSIDTHLDVVPQLSIVSLTKAGKIVIGGTSVWGGLGVLPARNEASIFGWDVAAKKKIFEIVPVVGAKAITALISDQKGIIWGVADGVLFSFNPANQTILSQQVIYPVSDQQKKVNVWHSVSMVLHPDNSIYLTGGGKMFKFDPVTKKVSTLVEKASKLTIDYQGKFYFSRGTHLWQYTPGE